MRRKLSRLAAFVLPVVVCAIAVPVAFEFFGSFSKTRVFALPEEEPEIDADYVLELGDNTISMGRNGVTCAFTPAVTAYYQFYSTTPNESSLDPYASLKDPSTNEVLTSDDDSGAGYNFQMIYKLTAGKTYTLLCTDYSSSSQSEQMVINVSVTDDKDYELELDKETEVNLQTSLKYVDCYFTPLETSYYEFSIDTGNVYAEKYLYDGSSNQLKYANGSTSSILCKLNAEETYKLAIEAGFSGNVVAGVCVKKCTPTTSGQCGDNSQWVYDLDTSTLTITGSGAMYDFAQNSSDTDAEAPWSFFRKDIKNLVIGSNITYIGSFSFDGCSSLESVTIPDSVVSVGKNVFSSCSGMTTATIGAGLTEIADHMFYHCDKLTSVTISPNAVITKIADEAFHCCYRLKSFSIPSTVTSIGYEAFCSCNELPNLVIPAKVTSIGEGAFESCRAFTEIAIPNGVTAIEDYTFDNCYNLISITIPDSVESIGEKAFYYCCDLSSVHIPDGVKRIEASTFEYCTSLEDIEIPDSVVYIGDSAFCRCENLSSVVIPEGVTSIESYTFFDCYCLQKVVIPSAVTSIGEEAFYYCYNLSDISLPAGLSTIGDEAFYGCGAITELSFGTGLQSIGERAISHCASLENVSIPSTKLERVGDYAFEYCEMLKTVTIESGTIGPCAFSYCNNLESVILGDGVTGIGYRAFEGLTKLKSLSLGNGLTIIGAGAFCSCESLEAVTIPGSVQYVLKEAFANCYGLTSLTLEEGLEYIDSKAFACCEKLNGLTIPSTVTYVGKSAFNGCDGIKDVYCYADPEKLEWKDGFSGNDFINDMSTGGAKQTRCHVYANQLDNFTSSATLSVVNVTYVGDLDNHIPGERLYGYSLSLGGNIGVSFYMDIDVDQLSNNAYMLFGIPNGDAVDPVKVYVRDVVAGNDTKEVNGKTYYLFRCSVSAKDAASTISAQLIDGQRSGTEYAFSVKQYAEYVLAHPEVEAYADAAPLTKALLSYCTCAQKYFGTNPDKLDESCIDYDALAEVTSITCSDPQIVLTQLPGVTFEGATLSLKSEMTLSLYFSSDEDLTFSCSGKTVETTTVNGYKVARIRGILASEIGDYFELGIGLSGQEGKLGMVRYSVLNYCDNILRGNYKENLQNVVKSIYLYCMEAKAYAPD